MQICAILLLREFEHSESLKVVCSQPPTRRHSACLYTKVVLQNHSESIIFDCQIFLLRIDTKVHYDFIQKAEDAHNDSLLPKGCLHSTYSNLFISIVFGTNIKVKSRKSNYIYKIE